MTPHKAETDRAADATYSGFVIADSDVALPTRIRAVATDGTVCGFARVEPFTELVGWYELDVASGAQKAGCPHRGEPIFFRLIVGMLDPEHAASGVAEYEPGRHLMHLFVARTGSLLGFAGDLPPAASRSCAGRDMTVRLPSTPPLPFPSGSPASSASTRPPSAGGPGGRVRHHGYSTLGTTLRSVSAARSRREDGPIRGRGTIARHHHFHEGDLALSGTEFELIRSLEETHTS